MNNILQNQIVSTSTSVMHCNTTHTPPAATTAATPANKIHMDGFNFNFYYIKCSCLFFLLVQTLFLAVAQGTTTSNSTTAYYTIVTFFLLLFFGFLSWPMNGDEKQATRESPKEKNASMSVCSPSGEITFPVFSSTSIFSMFPPRVIIIARKLYTSKIGKSFFFQRPLHRVGRT